MMQKHSFTRSLGLWLVFSLLAMMLAAPAEAALSDIAAVSDPSNMVLGNPKGGASTMMAAANAFYNQGFEDEFDFLFVFLVYAPTIFDDAVFPDSYPVQQGPSGTGAPAPAYTPGQFGSAGRLKVVGDLFAVSNFTSNPSDAWKASSLSSASAFSQKAMLGRAMMRYWGGYLKLPGSNANGLLGASGYWSYFFANGGSVLGGNAIRSLTPGEFIADGTARHITDIDRYLMGVLPKEDVEPMFWVNNPNSEHSASDLPDPGGDYFEGNQIEVTIDDIISENGQVAEIQPTELRCAFVLISPGAANTTDLTKLDNLRQSFQSWVATQTNNKITMNCRLSDDPADGDAPDGDEPQECIPGNKRCNIKSVEECIGNNQWQFVEDCGIRDLFCQDGACVSEITDGDDPNDCQSGQTRCNGDMVERCEGGSWMYVENCADFSLVCSTSSGLAECVDPDTVDGDSNPTDGDTTQPTDGDAPTVECTLPTDCPFNNRCTSAGLCEPCESGTELRDNICFAANEEEGGGGGCQTTGHVAGAFALLLLLAFFGLRRRA